MVVDDQPMVSRGVELLLAGERDLVFCGEAESEPQALDRIAGLKPDVAVVDLTLKEGTGLSLIGRLRQRCPELKILVFSMHDQAHYVAGAFGAGAHGYVTKGEGTEKLVEAIHVVMSGKVYLSEKMAAQTPGLVPGSVFRGIRRRLGLVRWLCSLCVSLVRGAEADFISLWRVV